MRVSTLVYTIKQGLRNIVQNKMFSIASIATMAACIFMFGVFCALILNIQEGTQTLEESLPILVYFEKDLTDKELESIKEQLLKRDEVIEVKYVSSEEAWETFKTKYFGDNVDVAAGFKKNPLENSDHYEVYMNDVSTQSELIKYAERIEGVRKINASTQAAEVISGISMILATISAGIIIFLLAIAIFLINNTVSMGVTIRREEIAIMKYIGAKDSFVRAPFIFEGVIIGLIGAAIPLIIFYFSYKELIKYIILKTEAFLAFSDFQFLTVGDVYKVLLPVGLALGVGIGFVGSFFTIRKHLKA